MASSSLCNLLDDLGLKEPSHTAESLSWTCQHEGARNLIKWICSNVSNENVLSLEELAEYNEMKQQGKVLEGDQLDVAFSRLLKGSEEDEEELEIAVQDGLEEIEDLRERKRTMTRNLDRLQEQKAAIEREWSETVESEKGLQFGVESANVELDDVMADMVEKESQLKLSLSSLHSVIQKVEQFYAESETGEQSNFLASSILDTFLSHSRSILRELSRWHAREFEQDADVADSSACGRQSAELDRLCRIFGRGEEQRALAVAELAQQEGRFEYVVNHSRPSEGSSGSATNAALRSRLDDALKLKSGLESEHAALRKEVSALCLRIGQLSRVHVLHGEYEFEHSKLRKAIGRYREFVKCLMDVLAIQLTLLKICQVEKERLQSLFNLLLTLEAELADIISSFDRRHETYGKLSQIYGGSSSSDLISEANSLLLESDEGSESDMADSLLFREAARDEKQLNEVIGAVYHLLHGGGWEDPFQMVPKRVDRQCEDLEASCATLQSKIQRMYDL